MSVYKQGSIGLFFRGDPALKGYWRLDGRAVDESGNGNHGTTISGTILVPARFGLGYKFINETDNIQIPDNASLDISGNFTIFSWLKVSEYTGEDMAIAKGAYPNYNYRLEARTGHFQIAAGIGGVHVEADSSAFPPGRWHFVCGVYDGSALKIYVDGKFEASSAASGAVSVNADPIYLGKYEGTDTLGYKGILCEFAIFSRDLDKNEISQYYRWATGNPKLTVTYTVPSGPANLKSYNGLAIASMKSIMGLGIADIKSVNGLE